MAAPEKTDAKFRIIVGNTVEEGIVVIQTGYGV